MIFLNHAPVSPINQWIDCFIYFKGFTPEHEIERVVPDGHLYLIFELDGIPRFTYHNKTLKKKDCYTDAWISGMHKNCISISAHPDSEMFVVRFKPGGGYPFLHIPLHTLTDKVIPAKEVLGNEVNLLRNVLQSEDTPESKFKNACEWLENKFDESKKPENFIHSTVSHIINDPLFIHTSLPGLVKGSGHSTKHFLHLFKKYVGLTPKYLQRIMRFMEVLKRIQEKQPLSWAQISYQCGYFDQAHFIREFRHFSGFNPQEFLRKEYDSGEKNFFPVQ